LTTRRARKWHVVTASNCKIYCFNAYLIPFRSSAVIMRRDETNEEEFLANHFLMQFNATVMNSYFHTEVTNLNEFALDAKKAPRCSKQAQPQLFLDTDASCTDAEQLQQKKQHQIKHNQNSGAWYTASGSSTALHNSTIKAPGRNKQTQSKMTKTFITPQHLATTTI